MQNQNFSNRMHGDDLLPRIKRRLGILGIFIFLLGMMSMSPLIQASDASLKEDAKKAGRAAGTAVREVGQGAKKVGKEIGHGARDAGREFRKAVKGH